jgi:hypothetical protein
METFNFDEAVDDVFGFVGTLPETWVEADFTQKQHLQSLISQKNPSTSIQDLKHLFCRQCSQQKELIT